jgi:hypothetical protein
MLSRSSTPAPTSHNPAQQLLLASDPKYRKHQANVERVLSSFENVNDWADIITFLSRLLKVRRSCSAVTAPSDTFSPPLQVLQTPPTYPVIPHTLTVAKRLAQCLNPALPTGVHQRALDVYAHIFTLIGPDGLKRDLPAWSSGLFPFFGVAATGVRVCSFHRLFTACNSPSFPTKESDLSTRPACCPWHIFQVLSSPRRCSSTMCKSFRSRSFAWFRGRRGRVFRHGPVYFVLFIHRESSLSSRYIVLGYCIARLRFSFSHANLYAANFLRDTVVNTIGSVGRLKLLGKAVAQVRQR